MHYNSQKKFNDLQCCGRGIFIPHLITIFFKYPSVNSGGLEITKRVFGLFLGWSVQFALSNLNHASHVTGRSTFGQNAYNVVDVLH